MVEKRINVIVSYFTKGMKKLGQNTRAFNQVMGMGLEGFKKQNEANVSMVNSGAKLGNRIRMLTHGMRGFRMEMLGVMFFGMGVMKFFQGLLQPAGKLVGLFELINIALGLVFLPIMSMILEVLLPFLLWLINLPEGVKLAIGAFVVFGAILGTLLFLFGMFALGIGSLIQAFGFLFGGIAVGGSTLTAIQGLFLGFLPILGIIAAAIAVAVLLWQSDLGGFREFVTETFGGLFLTVKETFGEIFKIVGLVWGMIIDLLEGDFDSIGNKFMELVGSVDRLFAKLFVGLGQAVFNFGAWLFNALSQFIMNTIVGGLAWIVQKFFEITGNLQAAAQVEGFRNMLQFYTPKIKFITAAEVGEGFKKIDETFGKVAEVSNEVKDSFGNVIGAVDGFEGSWNESTKTISDNTNLLGTSMSDLNYDFDDTSVAIKELQDAFNSATASLGGTPTTGGRRDVGSSLPGGGSAFGGSPLLTGNASVNVSITTDTDSTARITGGDVV